MKKPHIILLIFISIFMFGCSSEVITITDENVKASYKIYKDMEDKVGWHELILIGTVTGKGEGKAIVLGETIGELTTINSASELQSMTKAIVTLVPFRIDEVLKGDESLVGETLYLVQSGGIIDGYEYIMGHVEFANKNSEYIVFVEMPDTDLGWLLHGQRQDLVEIKGNGVRFNKENFKESRKYSEEDGLYQYLKDIRAEVKKEKE